MEKDIGAAFKFLAAYRIAFCAANRSNRAGCRAGRATGAGRPPPVVASAEKPRAYLGCQGDITAPFQPDDLYFQFAVPVATNRLENEIIDKLRSFMFSGRIKGWPQPRNG